MDSSLLILAITCLLYGTSFSRQIVVTVDDDNFHYDPNCKLTMKWKGVEIFNGADVSAYLGSDVDIECTAYCTGSGVTPAFQWRKNGKKVPSDVGRVYHYETTSERRSVLHIGEVGTYDFAKYICKGWIKGLGWKSKFFNLKKGCPEGFEECDSHRCISSDKICDGVTDCQDGTDEMECVKCKDDEFECDDECKPKRWLCDIIQHCSDGFDELNCEYNNCSAAHFQCGSGECIDGSYRCDNYPDCEDNSDETGCPQCSAGEFPCNDGGCIKESYACDGYPDCLDMSDENQCSEATEVAMDNCTDDFLCENGECILFENVCDGFEDCFDGSDENNCENNVTSTIVPITREISSAESPTVDSTAIESTTAESTTVETTTIESTSTERTTTETTTTESTTVKETTTVATTGCQTNQAQCSNGDCIPERRWCDGYPDCLDFSDETQCGKTSPKPSCGTDEFMCNTGECIQKSKMCDSHPDCPGEEDETSGCPEVAVCSEGQRSCKDGTGCYSVEQICNLVKDCPDGSDEQNCIVN